MNVNIWGPELWSILHGIAGLEKSLFALPLFADLCVLLPCIHCRKSYCAFYSNDECKEAFAAGKSMEYVYKIHNYVNDKLELQRLDKLFQSVKLDESAKHAIQSNFLILSTRPSIQVVFKRFELSEGKPFPDSSVWKVLLAFALLIDEEGHLRREALKRWIPALGVCLARTLNYKSLASKLQSVSLSPSCSSKEAFVTLVLAREGITEGSLKQKYASQKSWLKPLWTLYKRNLPAGSCGSYTCA